MPESVTQGIGGTTLRLARLTRGLSQEQLAGMVGVSRQAVSAAESGRSDPSLRVALGLARALGLSVEDVFGPGTPAAAISTRPVAPLGGAGSRVAMAQVGDTFVALPLGGAVVTTAGFVPAGGLADDTASGQPEPGSEPSMPETAGSRPLRSVRPLGSPRTTLVVAGSDPALPLLEVPLGLLDQPVAFAWWSCGSEEALSLAAEGLVHAAVVQLSGGSPGHAAGRARELLRRDAIVMGFCSRREGLVIRPELAATITGIADVQRAGLRIVNWEPGADARGALDLELARHEIEPHQLPGYETRSTGHLQVAAAIAAGLADAGVASEPAALAYGLAFVPLTSPRLVLVIPAAARGSREVQGLQKALSTPWLFDQLASLPGYEPSDCGKQFA